MKKVIAVVVISIVALVAAGVGVWLFISQQSEVVVKDPQRLSTTSTAVCDDSAVSIYNKAMYYEPRNGNIEPSLDKEGLNRLMAEIKTKQGYKVDPTCQTMLFWVAIMNEDYQGASSAYKSIRELHSKRIFADSNMRSNSPLFEYEAAMKGISPSDREQDGGFSDND